VILDRLPWLSVSTMVLVKSAITDANVSVFTVMWPGTDGVDVLGGLIGFMIIEERSAGAAESKLCNRCHAVSCTLASL
jgi:hypothetical protein